MGVANRFSKRTRIVAAGGAAIVVCWGVGAATSDQWMPPSGEAAGAPPGGGIGRSRVVRTLPGETVATDALLTPDGERMAPATDRFADRLTYLEQANRYLDTLDDDTRVVAVQV